MGRGNKHQPEHVDRAKWLTKLEQEKSKQKRLVADLLHDNLVLNEFASGDF